MKTHQFVPTGGSIDTNSSQINISAITHHLVDDSFVILRQYHADVCSGELPRAMLVLNKYV